MTPMVLKRATECTSLPKKEYQSGKEVSLHFFVEGFFGLRIPHVRRGVP